MEEKPIVENVDVKQKGGAPVWAIVLIAVIVTLLVAMGGMYFMLKSKGIDLLAKEPTATPTLALPPCQTDEAQASAKTISNLINKFNDFVTIADKTPRHSLATMISDMQSVKSDLSSHDPHSCFTTAKTRALRGMSDIIEAFTNFLANKGKPVESLLDSGFEWIADARRDLANPPTQP